MNLEVNFCGVKFKNPVTVASGTFGFGHEYSEFYDLSQLGGISVKGLTLDERQGNLPPRICETSLGILNSVGLQNPGVDLFIKREIPFLRRFDTNIIANISGNTVEEYCSMAQKVSDCDIDLIEMNISCPNVKEGGMAFGTKPSMAAQVVRSAKRYAKKPLIVKLSPNVSDIAEIAKAVAYEGADAISLINTILGMRIDINSRKPMLANVYGGLSGRAVFPIALRMVHQVHKAVNIPIIGMGGIASGADAIEMMMAGADLVAVGTQNLSDPKSAIRIIGQIKDFLTEKHICDVNQLVGSVTI